MRWHRGVAMGLVLLACAADGELRAQTPPARPVKEEGVRVDFQDADLGLVIAALAEAGGLNLTYSEMPARRVTLRMQRPVPREEILPLLKGVATSNGLRVIEEGTFVRLEVAVPASAASRDTAVGPPPAEVRLFVYRLKHARAAKLGATLQSIFVGRRSDNAARSPGLVPLSEGIREHQARTATDSGAHVDVEVGSTRMAGIPGQLKGEVQIVPDETTNALLIRAQANDWDVLKQAIEALDLRPLQVLIEVVIAEVRRTSDREFAISGRVADTKTNPTGRGTLTGPTDGNVLLELLRAGTLDVRAALSLLSTRGSVHILSRPIVLAQNNQEARILIGSERPFVQVSRTLPTDAGVRDQVIQYRDVGTKLTILPTINDDGYVNLQVLQEVSTATAETQFDAPIISTREASTYLFVRDGQTVVLGGLIDRLQEKNKTGIPLLMDLPLLGALFGSTRTTTSNSELFLFLTPHIVTTDADQDRIRAGVTTGARLLDEAGLKGTPLVNDSTPP